MKRTSRLTKGMFTILLCLTVVVFASDTFAQGTWTTKAPMPTARNDLAAAGVGGVLYAVGGKTGNTCTGLQTLEAYDAATNTWSPKAAMPTGRYGPGAAALNGLLYVVGGDDQCRGGFQVIGAVEAYDPVSNSWSTKASMPTARSYPGVAVVNGVLYVLGGAFGNDTVPTVEAYDPATNTWTTKAPMLTGRYGPIVGVVNGIIYIATGVSFNGVADVEAYDPDPATDAWTTKAPCR